MTCLCEHNTAGPDCAECAEGYYGDATIGTGNADCQPCNCDPEGSVSQQCNSNGRCSCKPGVTGDKCGTEASENEGKVYSYQIKQEQCALDSDELKLTIFHLVLDDCKPNHFISMVSNDTEHPVCKPCNCDPIGSESQQCNLNGKCTCKPGVAGDKCDTTANGMYRISRP